MRVQLFCVFWWDRAIAVGLHTCSCPVCRRREYARSPLNSGQWCHSWGPSEKHQADIIRGYVHALAPLPPPPLFYFSPGIGPSWQQRQIHPQPSDGLSATWRRAVWWLRPTGRPCGPSSGLCSQTDNGSQSATRHKGGRGRPPIWKTNIKGTNS